MKKVPDNCEESPLKEKSHFFDICDGAGPLVLYIIIVLYAVMFSTTGVSLPSYIILLSGAAVMLCVVKGVGYKIFFFMCIIFAMYTIIHIGNDTREKSVRMIYKSVTDLSRVTLLQQNGRQYQLTTQWLSIPCDDGGCQLVVTPRVVEQCDTQTLITFCIYPETLPYTRVIPSHGADLPIVRIDSEGIFVMNSSKVEQGLDDKGTRLAYSLESSETGLHMTDISLSYISEVIQTADIGTHELIRVVP